MCNSPVGHLQLFDFYGAKRIPSLHIVEGGTCTDMRILLCEHVQCNMLMNNVLPQMGTQQGAA